MYDAALAVPLSLGASVAPSATRLFSIKGAGSSGCSFAVLPAASPTGPL